MTKKTKKVILSAAVLAALLVTGLCLSLLSGDGGSCYYTQVDNSRLQRVHSNGGVIDLTGGLDYSYTLPAYGEDGAARELTFGMSRELREGAFLRLTVKPLRGVIAWAEVRYSELPVAVRLHYEPPAGG